MKRLASCLGCIDLLLLAAVATTALAQDRSGRGGDRGAAPGFYQRFKPTEGVEHVSEELEKSYTRMSEQVQQPIPKRTYEVVLENKAQKTKLFRADPKLLENKFIARVVLLTTRPDDDTASDGS